jgi:TolB-like protein/Flp pilus assembly protein TadD
MGLFEELKRRNVFRVAIAYAIVAWLVMQVGDTMAPALHLGDWVNSVLAFFLILGFPVAMFFAWVFELTPDGLKLEKNVDRTESVTAQTGKKANRLIIGVLVVAVAYFALDKFVFTPAPGGGAEPGAEEITPQEPAISDQSIAVLPFADLSPEGDQAYFSDGIAEEILNVLVRVEDLSVASRTSSFGFKGQEALGLPAIAEKLKVRHVLEGSVRKAGDTVRVTAQLIDARTDQHLWSETYDRQLTAQSIFAIQDEIAQAIVAELGVLIDDQPVQADTENLDAYEMYLKAHQTFLTRSDIPGAIEMFEKTVELDPGFGRAVAGLSAAYAVAPSWGYTDRDYVSLAEAAARRAIELDPTLAIAYSVLGYVGHDKRDLVAALEWYDRAIETNANDPTAWLWRGILNNELGYFERAASDIDRCLQLDPVYTNCMRHRARTALYSGDEDLAMALSEQVMLLGSQVELMMLPVYAARGNDTLVLAMLSRVRSEQNSGPLIAYEYRALTDPGFDYAAQRDEIATVYKATTGKVLDWGADSELFPMTFGVLDKVRPNLWYQNWWHPYPVEFPGSPDQKRVIRETGIPDYWREHGFPAHCRPVGDDDFECDRLRADADDARKPRVFAPR